MKALLAATALLPMIAAAQTAAPQISGAPTREEIERSRPAADLPAQPGRLTVEGGVERAPCPLADPQYAAVTVNFADVRFNGLAVVDPESLKDSWSDMTGRDVPIASVCEIRDRAATALREMGYLAAVQVPPQRIDKGGTVVLDVLMAKLVGVEVRGDAGNSEKLIAAHLDALKAMPVFNVKEAERHLLLARDIPGYDVRLALRPAGSAPGEVIGEVQVTRRRLQVDVNIQNMGSKTVGRIGALARVQLNDLTGMGDSSVLSLFSTAQTSEQTVLQAGHSMALGSNGLRLSGDFTYAWSKPDIIDRTLESETLIATAQLTYPLVRRQSRNLLGALGIDLVNQDVDFVNRSQGTATSLSRDHLRVIFARLDAEAIDAASLTSTLGYSAAEPQWRIGGSVEVRQGIGGLGASEGCGVNFANCRPPQSSISRQDADPSAFVIRGSAYGEYRPIPSLTFSLSPRLQYSDAVLLSYEGISAGNYTVGRGYDPGILLGDSGIGFAAEMRVGSLTPQGPNDLALQPFGFFDAAWVWHNGTLFAEPDPQRLYSAGGGIRGAWGNHARFDLTVAVPLRTTGSQTQRSDVRVLLSVTTQLVPWR